MITIYNKIDKSRENTGGFQIIPSAKKLIRPLLLCLSAQNNYSKTIFGIMREGAQAARILTTQGEAGKFKMDTFPVDILGIRFEKDDQYQQSYTEIADKLIYPYLTKHGMEFDKVKKQARLINVLTYCDGAVTYQGIEDRLDILFKRNGFTDEQVHEILSQIGLIALETNLETGRLHATSAAFIDVNDPDIYSGKVKSYQQLLKEQPYASMYAPLGDTNGVLYIYEGRGIHKVKEFFKDQSIAKPAVCAITSMFLENSLENAHKDELIPIEVPELLGELQYYSNEKVEPKKLLQELDEVLSYDGAVRYSDGEAAMRMELDDVYKTLRKTNETLIRNLKEKEGQQIRLKSVVRGAYEFSSDATFQQILTSAHMWQPRPGVDLLSIPSDKQVRATILDGEREVSRQRMN